MRFIIHPNNIESGKHHIESEASQVVLDGHNMWTDEGSEVEQTMKVEVNRIKGSSSGMI